MKKFNYTKWVTDHKHGLITEQAGTGSATGSVLGYPNTNCYACERIPNPTSNPNFGAYVATGQLLTEPYTVPNFTYSGPGNQPPGYMYGPNGQGTNGYCGAIGQYQMLNTYYQDQSYVQSQCTISASLWQTGSGTGSSGACPGWPNYNNWMNYFSSLPNFSSNNPNQPCQMLCQKHTQWSTQIQTVGPNWANQLQCKIDRVVDLMSSPQMGQGGYDCVNSNAPACSNIVIENKNEMKKFNYKKWVVKNKYSLTEAAKPDYIDLDGDGDKEESMKKAAKDKKAAEKKKSKKENIDKLTKAIKEIVQDLDEHPVSYPHSHVQATCYGCINQVVSSHTTEWVLNPAAGNVNYCNDPIATPPISTAWWADDQQWIIDNICQYQTPAATGCTALTQPIASNFQANVQAHGWETTFECLIEAANNPCALLREKIERLTDKLPNVGPAQQTTIQGKIDFANNLYTTTYDCGLSPNQDPNLVGGGGMNFNPNVWLGTFTAMINNSGNPCNVLQNKIDGWQNKLNSIQTWSVSYKEMLEIKIAEAENLKQANNC